MSNDSNLNRYGYITQGDIPHLSNPDSIKNSKERPGILKMLGEMGIAFVSSAVAGSLLRGGVARTMSRAISSENATLRKVAEEFKRGSEKLDEIEGVLEFKGKKYSALELNKLKYGIKERGGTGILSHLPSKEYTKAYVINRGVNLGRRLPYEVPGYYVSSRLILDREQYEKDIREGRYNPRNPLDVIGDFAQKSVGYVVSDMVLSFTAPYAKDVARTTKKFDTNLPTDRLLQGLGKFGAIQKTALADNLHSLSKLQERQIVKIEAISDIFKEYNTVKYQRSLQSQGNDSTFIDVSLGPKIKTKVKVPLSKDQVNQYKSIYKGRLQSYDEMGPGAIFDDSPVLGGQFNRVYSEYKTLGELGRTRNDDGTLNIQNNLLVDNIVGRVLELSRNDLIENSSIGSLSRKETNKVFTEALNMLQREGINKTGLARIVTGSLRQQNYAYQSQSELYYASKIFRGFLVDDNLAKVLPGKITSLQDKARKEGIDLTTGEAKGAIEDAYNVIRDRASRLARSPRGAGTYGGEGVTRDITREAEDATRRQVSAAAGKYLENSAFKKIILNQTTNEDIANAAVGLFTNDINRAIGRRSALDVWTESIGGSSQEDAISFAKAILKKNGKAVDTYAESFNMFGLRRMSVEESVRYQRDYNRSMQSGVLTKDQKATALNSVYGADVLSRGQRGSGAEVLRQSGGMFSGNIAAEVGLYTTINGKVIDLRAAADMGMRTVNWMKDNMKVPIIGLNPLQMLGADAWLPDLSKSRIRHVAGGTNRTIYEEKLMDKLTHENASQHLFAPMIVSKGQGIGYRWNTGLIEDFGRLTTFQNRPSMLQNAARASFHEPRIPEWSEHQRGFESNVPKSGSRFGFGVRGEEGDRGRFYVRKPGVKAFDPTKSWINNVKEGFVRLSPDLDVSEDTRNSLFHTVKNWVNKSHFFNKNALFKRKPPNKNPSYMPNFIRDLLNNNTEILTGRPEYKNLQKIRTFLGSQYDERANALFDEEISKNTNLYGVGSIRLKGDAGQQLRTHVDRLRGQVSNLTEEYQSLDPRFINESSPSKINIDKTLNSIIGKIDDIAQNSTSRTLTSHEQLQVKQLSSNFQLLVSLVRGDESVIRGIESRADELYSKGLLQHKSYSSIKSQIASVYMYSTRLSSDVSGIMAQNISTTLSRAEDALNIVLGPRTKSQFANVGGKTRLQRVMNQYQATAENANWRPGSDSGVLERGGAVANIFGESEENWIAVRPFMSRSGISAGLKDLASRLSGGAGVELNDDNYSLSSAVKGILFGSKLGGSTTTGTMVGWHLTSRVLDVFERPGLGLSLHKYSSPADLFVRGGMGRRVVPIVGGLLALNTLQGVPGLGTQGIGGALATVFGPGAGMARAGVGQALNTLPGAFPGSQEFWSTYSAVTQSQEDDLSYKFGRTVEEEKRYWQQGDDPVRQGRYWILGSSQWKGGRVSFYEPNWYRRYMSQYQYTKEYKGSHLEWAAFGTDLSPLKYLDPYHYERKTKDIRPYPTTGDMFTGPWGPLTPTLNATVGQILKPKIRMHTGQGVSDLDKSMSVYGTENAQGALQLYSSGMIKQGFIAGYGASGQSVTGGSIVNMTGSGGPGAQQGSGGFGNGLFIQSMPRDNTFGFTPDVNKSQRKGLDYYTGEVGYLAKEWAGIYGFAGGAVTESLGFNRDFAPTLPTLESADRAFSYERQFWDLNLGGLGDFPMGRYGNVEFSEVTRRFLPHRRKNIEYVNNIPNQMPEWLPGPGSLIDFKTGDPYCISRNTIVEIDDLQFISADKVTTKDKITTHRGNKVKVQQISERSILPEESVYSLKISTLSGLTYEFSEEHPILIKDNNNTVFKKVKDLNKNDYVAYPIPKFEKEIVVVDMSEILPEYTFTENYIYICGSIDFAKSYEFIEMGNNKFLRGELKQYLDNNSINRKSFEAAQQSIKNNRVKRINRFIEIDSDIAYLIGIYIAEGWTGNGLVGLVHHITEKEYFNKAISGALKIDKNASYKISKEEDNYFYGHIYSKAVQKFLEYFVGKKSSEKIIPLFSSKLEKNILLNLLKGLFDGDGSIFLDNGKPRASLKTINKTIALQFRKLLLSYGYVFSIVKNNSGRQSIFGIDRLKSESYNVILRGKNAVDFAYDLNYISIKELFYTSEITNTYYDKDEEFIYLKVLSNNIIDTVDIVYGYEVNIDDSFCVAGFATHNTKIPKGEARLPGEGYKRLNALHPDEYGEYGAVDRFKILANVMPWSNEYRYWRKIVEQDSTLTEDEQTIVSEAKRQAAQRKKRLNLRKRIWDGRLEKFDTTGIQMSELDPNIFTTSSGETVRLAGVRFSNTAEGLKQAQDIYRRYMSGEVELYKDVEQESPLGNREKTTDVIAKVNGVNINQLLLKKIRSGELQGSESRANNYIDMSLRVGKEWQSFGAIEEAITHAEIPFLKSKLGKYDAYEWLEQKLVYGKQWQPWENPVESFIQPALDSYTKPNGFMGLAASATFTGILSSMFFRPGPAKMVAGITGGIAGLGLGVSHNIQSLFTGQRWIPTRRKKEAEVEEYMDILKYVKYTNLYEQYRQKAIQEEGIDVEQILSTMEDIGKETKSRYKSSWENAPTGGKPAKEVSKKMLETLGPIANKAVMYKNMAKGTMYGAPLSSDFMAMSSAVPSKYKPIFQELLEVPITKRDDVLQLLPRGMRRILQSQWGMEVEEKPDLAKYFKKHKLPGKEWEGYLPQVNLDEITIKIIKNEGLDTAEFGYYDNEVKQAMSMPWTAPDLSDSSGSYNDIMRQLNEFGITDASVRRTDTPGIHMNISLDMRNEIASSLGY